MMAMKPDLNPSGAWGIIDPRMSSGLVSVGMLIWSSSSILGAGMQYIYFLHFTVTKGLGE
jgi:hypothetical protein